MYTRYLCVLAVALLLAPVALAQRAEDEARAHLQRNAFRYGLSAADLTDLAVTDAYTSRRSGTTHVYLRQRAHGIEIAGAEFTVALDRNGRVFHAAGTGASALAGRAVPTSPSVSAEAAAAAVARDAGLTPSEAFRVLDVENGRAPRVTLSEAGVALEPVTARLVYRLDASDRLHLAWEVGLYERGAQHYWHAYVDAASGRVLERHDLVVHDHWKPESSEAALAVTPAAAPVSYAPLAPELPAATMAPLALTGSYRVYPIPIESPNHASPPPPADARVLVANPADPQASPFGWHDTNGAPGAEHTRTRGNNVHAYTDTNNDNNPDAGSDPDGGAGLLFDFPLDLTQQPSANRPAAVVNLFYWNNIFHDVMWHYGFDEPSGNFQVNNYGNGGLGNDDVRAEAQDGGGTCNANFFTPADGQRPRMQMYISSASCNPNPVQRDGSLDNGVILHEYSHGVSNRLVGGPSQVGCLSNSEQMGEGWSDYHGLILTMEPGDAGTDARGIGTWLFGQTASGPGIRPTPYSTNFAVNPSTYATTRTAIVPHGVGYVWATIAWEATWELIAEHGFDPDIYNYTGTAADAGNVVMLALVTEGMKLMPCSPGFVDARDGILAADQALYDGIHIDALWRAFARRGLGLLADQGSTSTNSDNVESFVEPEQIPPAPVTDLAAAPASLGVLLTWTATGDDGTIGTAASYDIRYATTGPITTDAEFSAATQVTGEPTPQPSGTPESFTVTGLAFNQTYHFAMKVSDESFNTSELSNPASTTTLGPPAIQVSTSPIQVVTPPNTQTTATFNIGNTGQSDLTFAINLDETGTAARLAPDAPARPARESAASAAVEAKGAFEATGSAPLRGSGGPDAFGYKWIDSDEPGGPTYSWFDISAIGTPGPSTDDSQVTVTLPFTFEFYGVPKTTVRMSSNGFLTFGSAGATVYTNTTIPNTAAPNDLVAGFWDDLNPATAGGQTDHYHDAANNRYIFQWTNVARYNDSASRMTFQIILYRGGQIEYMYNTMTGTLNSATVGIENAAGNDGLQVVYNAPYVHNALAVRFSSLWVAAEPAAGLVHAGSPVPVTLTFDAAGLDEGTYTADMTITTNDPASPSVVVPIVFTVGEVSAPTLTLTPASPPVVVPRGGSVTYTATLMVPPGAPSSLDYWAEATLPSGDVRRVFGPGTLNVTPGTYVRTLTQSVPGNAPLGDYTYEMKVGTYPSEVLTSDSFGLTVTAAAGVAAGEGDDTWRLYLEDGTLLEAGSVLDLRPVAAAAGEASNEAAAAASSSELPAVPALHAAYPNPLTASATLRYDVSAPGAVRVAVYDLLGRELTVLADGAHEAGRFSAVFDGRALPNGVYLVRMTAGGFSQTQRVTVLR